VPGRGSLSAGAWLVEAAGLVMGLGLGFRDYGEFLNDSDIIALEFGRERDKILASYFSLYIINNVDTS